ncbi:TatD family hydrolase [Hyphobacterium sp. CCMP332]|nr:TatD family hydrolase [Hyphobacterium sp. CCMP332]
MIDSHAHIYLDQFDEDQNEMIERAQKVGVSKIYMPNIDSSSIDRMLKTEDKYKAYCIPMMGLHPCSVKSNFEEELKIVENHLSNRKWSAIGEIGLDLFWDKSTLEIQIEALKIQIEWARQYNLPIVLHCRDAFDELFNVLHEVGTDNLKGVFHCFTGDEKELNTINELDFYIGIGGVFTYKKQNLTNIIHKAKRNRILLETDSPYLAPVPKRGKRNEPSYLEFIKMRLAEVLKMESNELEDLSSNNCIDFFNY